MINANKEFIKDFLLEFNDHAETVESSLVHIEKDKDNPDLINSIFRAFHSIKGNASWLGLDLIKDLSHRAENMLGDIRNKKYSITPEITDCILASLDTLKILAKRLSEGDTKPVDISNILNKIDAIRTSSPPKTAAPPPPPPQQSKTKVRGRDVDLIIMESGKTAIIKIDGRFDFRITDALLEKIEQLKNKGFIHIIFDLTNTIFISSSGAGVIASTHQELKASGGKVILAGARGEVKKIFEITGLTNEFEMYDNLKDAIKKIENETN
ncbi:MAG: anti-sigma factor antagonist [Nitrospinae bacterium]|nr:anti-sigma factor antagonist [Nitrospinota bacterium]